MDFVGFNITLLVYKVENYLTTFFTSQKAALFIGVCRLFMSTVWVTSALLARECTYNTNGLMFTHFPSRTLMYVHWTRPICACYSQTSSTSLSIRLHVLCLCNLNDADVFFLSCCVAVKIKKPIKTKFRMPVFNWVALKPNQINGTVFNEIDDEKILEVRQTQLWKLL